MSETDDETPPGPGHNSAAMLVDRLQEAALRSAVLTAERKALARRDGEIGKELERLNRSTLPELMAEFGSTKWESEDFAVAVAAKVVGTLNRSSNVEVAIAKLIEAGMGSAIHSTLTVTFDGDEFEKCKLVAATIAEHFDREVETTRTIHPSTLAAWAREQIKDGKPLDLDLFGLSTWREATVKEK